jgi:hypothetical protein
MRRGLDSPTAHGARHSPTAVIETIESSHLWSQSLDTYRVGVPWGVMALGRRVTVELNPQGVNSPRKLGRHQDSRPPEESGVTSPSARETDPL